MLGLGVSFSDVAVRQSGYDGASLAAFSAMAVQPDSGRKALYDALIRGLKADGIWDLLDGLYLFAAHHAQAGLVNLKVPSIVATLQGVMVTPSFTLDRGFTGNPAGMASVDLGLNDNGTANNQQNSGSVGAYVNRLPTAASAVLGLSISSPTRIYVNPTVSRNYRLHGAGVTVMTVPATGLYAVARTSANNLTGYFNGTVDGISTNSPSSAPTAESYRALCGGGIYSDARLGAVYVAGDLGDAKQAALNSRVVTYLAAIGGA